MNGTITFAGDNAPDYLLSDSVDLQIANGLILSLEVASDKPLNCNHFYKRVYEANINLGNRLTMSLFTKKELKMFYPNFTSEEVGIRFEVFGGSAINFAQSSVPDVPVLSVVEDVTRWYFQSEIYKTICPNVGNTLLILYQMNCPNQTLRLSSIVLCISQN
eukprot:gene13585-18234_t